MITQENWARLKPILESALDLTIEEIPAYLDEACREIPDLRQQAELLISAALDADRSLDFLDSPAVELAAPFLQLERSVMEQAAELEPGAFVGTYTIERRLGSGGMGVVYLAHDRRLDRKIALKLLPPWVGASESANRRFVQEAQAASRLDHPNIETIYEVGETADGRLYIAMAHYEGETLQDRNVRGPLEIDAAIDIARQISSGLAAAHARGIVHRDIKPGNVMVTPEGVAKIVDFGAAKMPNQDLTVHGVAHGTVAYMSPEQTHGKAVDARTDIWSLGVVLYEMLAGQRPFRGGTQDATIFAIRNDVPEPLARLRPEMPESIALVVERCLAKNPSDRYQTADELRHALDLLFARSRAPRSTLKRAIAGAAVTAVALTALLFIRGTSSRPSVLAPAKAIAVMAPRSVSGDSALTRLGRELAVTLSANLDGMGGIRTLPAITVLAHSNEKALSLDESARLASRLGAASFVYGTLVGSGTLVRLDLELITPTKLDRIAQVSVTAPADDINALTDAATIELLRRVWDRGTPPVPNLAAITTRSVPALRAYLEGELAFVRSNYDVAVNAFERAFAADSTFALAYWRSLYPRIYEGSRPDTAIVASIIAHRDRLPDPERLMVDAYAAPTVSEKMEVLRNVTRRFPDYWPGWYSYADLLVHDGPYLGTTYADARVALERIVTLNPDFASAWVHLHWMTSLQRDTGAVNRTVANLERLATPGAWVNPNSLPLAYAFQEMLRSGGEMSTEAASRLADGTALAAAVLENRALLLFIYGFPKGQLQQIDAVMQERRPPEVAAAQWRGRAFTWAGRGAWDSTFVAMEQWVRLSIDSQTALRAYGLAVLGVSTGAVDPDRARRWRPGAPPSAADTAEWLADRAWLDGIVAYAQGELPALAHLHGELRGSGARHADLLAASLKAYHDHASGGRREAALALAALELDAAEHGHHARAARSHPYLAAIHRPTAARWLLEMGDTLQALKLLPWHEAVIADGRAFTGRAAANRVAEPLALYERAQIEQAWRWDDVAREHYRGFLERYDLPPRQHRPMVVNARTALARSAGSR